MCGIHTSGCHFLSMMQAIFELFNLIGHIFIVTRIDLDIFITREADGTTTLYHAGPAATV